MKKWILDKPALRFMLKRTLQYFFYIAMPLALIFVGFLAYANHSFQSEARNMSLAQLSQVTRICDMVFGETKRLAARLSLQSDTKLLMTPSYRDVRSAEVSGQLRSYTLIHRYIDSIYISAQSNGLVYSSSGVTELGTPEEMPWLKFVDHQRDDIVVGSYVRNGIYPYLLAFSKPVLVEKQAARGAVVVCIDLAELSEVINQRLQDQGVNAYVLDENRQVLSGKQLKHIYGKNISEALGVAIPEQGARIVGDMVVSIGKSEQIPVYYVSTMALSHMQSLVSDSLLLVVLICLASFVATLVISFVITYKSTQTIRNVVEGIADPMKADLISNDLRFILEDIVQANQTHELDEALASRLYLLKREQAASLQAQISPHFLYNTLDTINWMAYADVGGVNRVSDSLGMLSDLFRYTLHKGNYVCALADEVAHVRTYAGLLKLRFSGRFQVEVALDTKYYTNVSVRFLLQPLVENAIAHGMKPTVDRLVRIVIDGRIADGMLIISVSDNGAGISDERLAWVNQMLERAMDEMDAELRAALSFIDADRRQQLLSDSVEAAPSAKGVGLRNVNARIKLIFGAKYGLTLGRNERGGATTEVRLPWTQWPHP